jgi:hypothetical protein
MLFNGEIAAEVSSVRRKLKTLKIVLDGITLKCAGSRLISHSAPRD